MTIDPAKIKGPWDIGFALDLHTVSSTFLGYDTSGRAQYDTVRSDLGELLYRLKYHGDKKSVSILAGAAADFLREQKIVVEVVVPLPPSKVRAVQPVVLIAQRLASELGIDFAGNALRKVKETPELKSMADIAERKSALADAFEADPKKLRGRRVLLLDDLYRSGASMAAASRALRGQGLVSFIAAVALTRTRVNR